MIAYLHKWITSKMVSVDREEGKDQATRLLRVIYDNYQNVEKREMFFFVLIEKKGVEEYSKYIVVDILKFERNLLFGSIGVISLTMDETLRERDLSTLITTDLKPSTPTSGYEYYTHFLIDGENQKLLIMRNGNMPSYINNLLAQICSRALETEPYTFRVEEYEEKTIRETIKDLKKSKITAQIQLADIELQQKATFKRLRAKADGKGYVTLTFNMEFQETLDDDIIDDLIEIREDKDVKKFIIIDRERDPKNSDEINLLKETVKSKREVNITKKDMIGRIEEVYGKMVEALRGKEPI